MDLSQKKLTKAEWLNVEIPVVDSEKVVLQLIVNGYRDVNLRINNTSSLLSKMKLGSIPNIHNCLFDMYFAKPIADLYTKYSAILGKYNIVVPSGKKNALKKGDLMRVQITDSKLKDSADDVFEYTLISFCKELLSSKHKNTSEYAFYLYTLIQIIKNSILDVNEHVMFFVKHVICQTERSLNMHDVLSKSHEFIEKNKHLLKYADIELFEHQRQIFTLFKQYPTQPKLVLYTAPTGTGKTLTPIGLSQGHRIIFICAARHIGLALAKSAISVDKRVAIAFGCDTPDDIRLHYYAASEYTRNKRSGGIGKVDNSVGDKVEIMICDVQSYLIAMNYMLAFSNFDPASGEKPDDDIITYWDEPTISMDYDSHPLHEQIQQNWKGNKISKLVLSCATLPHEEEILDVLNQFRCNFDEAAIHTINSYDCRKSISLLNAGGKSVVPHLLYSEYKQLQICEQHCRLNKSLLRYFDLVEIVRFIQSIHINPGAIPDEYRIEKYFEEGISMISMNSLKMYYLDILRVIRAESFDTIHTQLVQTQLGKFDEPHIRKFHSMPHASTQGDFGGGKLSRMQSVQTPSTQPDPFKGVRLTGRDAHTLTDGPTIYLVEDVERLAQFYVAQSNIPESCLKNIMKNIEKNNVIQKRITALENTIEEQTTKGEDSGKGGAKNDKKLNRESDSSDIRKMNQQLDELRKQIEVVSMISEYIPNTVEHQRIWLGERVVQNAFMPRIDGNSAQEIMMLDVSNEQKLLLLMGVGMFLREENANPRYLEIMKKLAYQQCLFVIIASSDYIYGTNYQFCHGFIGKDLTHMTQQKTIQALGRIGRNQTQQEYTVRFRKDDTLKQLFHPPIENREAIVMNRLFG